MNYPADPGDWTKRKRISVSLNDHDHGRVLEMAEANDCSRAQVVKRLVRFALDYIPRTPAGQEDQSWQ